MITRIHDIYNTCNSQSNLIENATSLLLATNIIIPTSKGYTCCSQKPLLPGFSLDQNRKCVGYTGVRSRGAGGL